MGKINFGKAPTIFLNEIQHFSLYFNSHFQKKIESTPKMSLMEQLKLMKSKIIDNVESQNALLEESEKVEKAAQEYF